MPFSPLIVSLPIADRRTSYEFYREGLGLETIGEPAEDGLPEPLQFALNDGVSLMLVPSVGFGWVIGDNEVAGRGDSECMLGLSPGDEAGVDDLVERVRQAGGQIVTDPGEQPWGYAGAFADPDGHLWMVAKQAPA